MLTRLSGQDESAELVREWINSYVARPHAELGRRGAVCPYVPQALAADSIELTEWRFGPAQDLAGMKRAIREGIERFRELEREKESEVPLALIVTFPDLRDENRGLVDEGHLACKTDAVKDGLMLGQFHRSCDAPAAHNPDFPVNRSPVPLLVIRAMSSHDALFLDGNPTWMEHYRATMARLGTTLASEGSHEELVENGDRDRAPDERAPYVRYADADLLQEMQSPHTDSPLELSFILITQVKELLFRMLYVELDTARTHLRAGNVEATCGALARANRVQRVLSASWEVLTGMSPTDFLDFRDALGEASGRQSFMYRAVEFIMGNKDPGSLDHLREFGSLHRFVEREVSEPSLYDEAVAYLHRNVRPIDGGLRGRDFSHPHVASAEVEAAWLDVYRAPSKYAKGFALAEALMELAFQFSRWRATHLLVVERMIGSKPGTGGTKGVEWLRRVSDHRFFPELWSVRTEI